MNRKLAVALLSLLVVLPAQAQVQQTYKKFLGRSADWFDPANWEGGTLPTAGDDVLVDGKTRVVIDPANGAMPVQVRDLVVRGTAQLETMPGTIVELRHEIVEGDAQVWYRSSGIMGDSLVAAPRPSGCFSCGGLKLNPSTQSKRTYVLKSSFPATFGLGGTEPASIIKTGPGRLELAAGMGHYATLNSDLVVIEEDAGIDARIDRVPLRLSLHYGFRPRHGDVFQIITVNQRLVGTFRGMPEGALVGCTDDNVGFHISYRGGDGNDVVLSAKDTSPAVCLLLPAVQKVREAAR